MEYVDVFYWKLLGFCFFIGILFFFITTDSLIRGKLSIPAWVFSLFTLTIGVFFFRVSINSLNEFSVGRHESMDELIDAWALVSRFLPFG